MRNEHTVLNFGVYICLGVVSPDRGDSLWLVRVTIKMAWTIIEAHGYPFIIDVTLLLKTGHPLDTGLGSVE